MAMCSAQRKVKIADKLVLSFYGGPVVQNFIFLKKYKARQQFNNSGVT
jgi:hypothetical protein